MPEIRDMWDICDEVLRQVIENPIRKEELFGKANDFGQKGVMIVALQTAMIPKEGRGEWRDAARKIAREFLPDGVDRWIFRWEDELFAQISPT